MTESAADRIKTELEAVDTEQAYRDFLNECYPDCDICGMSFRGRSAELLEELDNTAFRTGYNDWLDGELRDNRWIDVDGEYYDADEVERIEEDAKCSCGEELDKDCEGNFRCPICDGPCPCCSDGSGPQ